MTIGEFSSRTGLSAKVLRNYADQGVLVPSAVDPASGYRYYDTHQLDDAVIVALLRRAGIPVADIRRFLAHPVAEAVDGWERSLVAEVNARRQALSEARGRMGLSASPTRGATMVEIRPVDDREELRQVFDLVGGELSPRIDTTDFRFRDLDSRFPADRPLMVAAVAEGRSVGGALAFRNDNGVVTLRMIAVVEEFRHRGIGRRLVERVETEARLLGVERIGLGTDDPEVGFYFHLGYTPNLLFQWAYDEELYDQESEAVLTGPLKGLRHWRSSFNAIPQLFVELDEPRLDLRNAVRDMVSGCHVGFVMFKDLGPASLAS
jgi:DNA-binding transcriptional MerR regulator